MILSLILGKAWLKSKCVSVVQTRRRLSILLHIYNLWKDGWFKFDRRAHTDSRGVTFSNGRFYSKPQHSLQMAARVRAELKSTGRRFLAAAIRAILRRRHLLILRQFPRWRFPPAASFTEDSDE